MTSLQKGLKDLVRTGENRCVFPADITAHDQGTLWILYQILHNAFKEDRQRSRKAAR